MNLNDKRISEIEWNFKASRDCLIALEIGTLLECLDCELHTLGNHNLLNDTYKDIIKENSNESK